MWENVATAYLNGASRDRCGLLILRDPNLGVVMGHGPSELLTVQRGP